MGFPLGQPIRLPTTDTDTTPGSETYGDLVDPGGLELLIQPPGGAIQTYTYGDGAEIVKESTGSYYYDLTPEVPGQWSYRWIATGDYAGATLQQYITVDSSSIG